VYFLHISRSASLAARAPAMVHTPVESVRVQTTMMSRPASVGAQTAKNVGSVAGTRLSTRNATGA
jgi:hypothetical protein